MHKNILTYQDWKTLFKASFASFLQSWWRIAIIHVFTLLLLVIGAALLAGLVWFIIFEGSIRELESFVMQIQLGLTMPHLGGALFFGVLFLIFVIVVSTIGKIAGWLAVKHIEKKKSYSSFSLYFVSTWHFFWRSIAVFFQALWYVVWPALLAFVLTFVLAAVYQPLAFLYAVSFFLLIWRGWHIFFILPVLIHFDKDSSRTLVAAIDLIKGNWWRSLVFVLGFSVFVMIPQFLLSLPETLSYEGFVSVGDGVLVVFSVLSSAYSFFVVTPLVLIFFYKLMLYLSKAKKITL